MSFYKSSKCIFLGGGGDALRQLRYSGGFHVCNRLATELA